MSMQDTPRPDVLDEMRAYEQSHRMQSRDGFRPDHAETADRYQRYADALESARADTRTAFADRDAAITRMAEYAAVIEGLRQSAAGETHDLGSFAEYADIEIDEEGGR